MFLYGVVTPEVIVAVEIIVKKSRCVTVDEAGACVNISHDSAHYVNDILQFNSFGQVVATPADFKLMPARYFYDSITLLEETCNRSHI